MTGFSVAATVRLQIESMPPLSEMYVLSPFVWAEGSAYKLMLRAVPRSQNPAEKIARIYYGESNDGLRFRMQNDPVIAPGPEPEDKDGCEDPTVAVAGGVYYVYYTGWNETEKRGRLLLASGTDPGRLEKRGVALQWTPEYQNPKEATIVQARDGSWRLFFEYAAHDASKIGVASAAAVGGPWKILEPFFDARPRSWDSWHLSTGPILSGSEPPIMFYNGATRDAMWRIGWIAFDGGYTRVLERGIDPLIGPPADREPGDTDIAFAASAIRGGDDIWLYYSVADKDMLRATVRQVSHR